VYFGSLALSVFVPNTCTVAIVDFITQKYPLVISRVHTFNDERGSEKDALSVIISIIT
jgi:hypothetical protein